MSTIVTRAGKGSPLTNSEVDSNFQNLNTDKAELSGAAFTGAITTNSTVDGVDIATRDAVLTSITTTANAALPKAGGAMTGAITTNSTFDGRDVATDGTKLDGIEASATADQTGAQIKTAYEAETNAFTDAQFTKLGGIEASATADQTAAQIKTAYESNANTQAFTDADHTKLDGIEASADVTDTANVTSAGALMDSELTAIASVKALNQGVATGDSPTFVNVTANGGFASNGNSTVGGTFGVTGANAAIMSLIAPTDNATFEIRGGNSDTGVEEANIVFYQNNAAKWQLGNSTDNGFKLYNYAQSNYALTVNSTGAATFAGDIIANKHLRLYTTDDQAQQWYIYTHTDDTLRFNYNGSGADELIFATDGAATFNAGATFGGVIQPSSVNGIDLGANGAEFRSLYLDTSIIASNALSITTGTDLTLDVAGNIFLDADGSLIVFRDGSLEYGRVGNSSSDFVLQALVQDKDIVLKGNDNGTIISALTLDMSAAGAATFNSDVIITGTSTIAHGGDTDTYLQFDANDQFRVVTGGAERFAVINAGVVVNEDSHDADFRVESNNDTHALFVDGATGNVYGSKTSSSMTTAGWGLARNGGSEFVSQGNNITALKVASADDAYIALMKFYTNGGTEAGYILGNGSALSLVSNSDYRLKENVVDLTGATERLKQIPVHSFNFINNPDETVQGFLAHELKEILPQAAHGTKDEVDADGNPVYQGIDQSQLVPLLVRTVQELEARIAALES